MKGYKALDKNMRAICGDGMQYEMNKLYSIKGDVIPCKNGFHFCKVIEELNGYYNIKSSRVFEVEANGMIIDCYKKYAAEKIQLVRELTKEEINDYFKRNQNELINNMNYRVRAAVADQGYGLDILINDICWQVRAAVAKQGYGLDILTHDQDYNVRIVAEAMADRKKIVQ